MRPRWLGACRVVACGLLLSWPVAAGAQTQSPPTVPPSGGAAWSGPVCVTENGTKCPLLTKEVKPSYTWKAVQAKIEGTVHLECVVTPQGVCTDIKVVRGLDPQCGLNEEAVSALRKWRFRPGTKDNKPVPVLITVELNFALGPPAGHSTGGDSLAGVPGCGPATGVECPVPRKQVNPDYTREAMEAKIQGSVVLECVVTLKGECSNIKVVKSLDAQHGLDQEAIKALRKWRFTPGTKDHLPILVLITVDMHFKLK